MSIEDVTLHSILVKSILGSNSLIPNRYNFTFHSG